jgi:carbon-monoxide dehydrogenase large subunit
MPTAYDVPNCAIDSRLVTINKPPWQGVRGYGKETANLVMERAVELIAEKLGLDPLEVRRKTCCKKTAFPHRLPSGPNLDSGDYEGALHQLLELFNRNECLARKADAVSSDRCVGKGFSLDSAVRQTLR